MPALVDLSIAQARERIVNGELSPVALVQAAPDRIAQDDRELNVFRSVVGDRALEEAQAIEEAARRGDPLGPLSGIPVALKDNIEVAVVPMTAGTRFFDGGVPERDAPVWERMRAAGAVLVGKLHMAEWAIGGTTQNVHYGPCRNPWDPARLCGGSSGGSGAALAAGMALAALGTDTGGSARIPAALCGVTALRPSAGRVSNRGSIPVAWSFDAICPMACRAEDVAQVLSVVAGYDREDPASVDVAREDYVAALARGAEGLRIGLLTGDWLEMTARHSDDLDVGAAGYAGDRAASRILRRATDRRAADRAAARRGDGAGGGACLPAGHGLAPPATGSSVRGGLSLHGAERAERSQLGDLLGRVATQIAHHLVGVLAAERRPGQRVGLAAQPQGRSHLTHGPQARMLELDDVAPGLRLAILERLGHLVDGAVRDAGPRKHVQPVGGGVPPEVLAENRKELLAVAVPRGEVGETGILRQFGSAQGLAEELPELPLGACDRDPAVRGLEGLERDDRRMRGLRHAPRLIPRGGGPHPDIQQLVQRGLIERDVTVAANALCRQTVPGQRSDIGAFYPLPSRLSTLRLRSRCLTYTAPDFLGEADRREAWLAISSRSTGRGCGTRSAARASRFFRSTVPASGTSTSPR